MYRYVAMNNQYGITLINSYVSREFEILSFINSLANISTSILIFRCQRFTRVSIPIRSIRADSSAYVNPGCLSLPGRRSGRVTNITHPVLLSRNSGFRAWEYRHTWASPSVNKRPQVSDSARSVQVSYRALSRPLRKIAISRSCHFREQKIFL